VIRAYLPLEGESPSPIPSFPCLAPPGFGVKYPLRSSKYLPSLFHLLSLGSSILLQSLSFPKRIKEERKPIGE
jgi:hypothetical protein